MASNPKFERFLEAYLTLEREADWGGKYFAEAIPPEQRARKNARDFAEGDASRAHWVGCTDFSTSKAAVFCVEAVRAMNQGSSGQADALRLLMLAADEVKDCLERRYLVDAMPAGPMQ
jgi:hypothetical protein